MPVINGVYTKDFPALGRAPIDTDIIPIAQVANQITYKSTIGEIFNAKVFGTTGRLSKFTSANTLGNSILNEIGNAIHLTNGGTSYASFGIINPGTPGDPGIDNDAYIGSTINNDFTIRVNNTEAARFDTAFRFKITNIPNADTDTDKFLVSDAGVVKYRTGAEVLSDIGGASASGYVPYTGATQGLNLGTNNPLTLADTGSNTSINVTSSSSGQGAILVTKSGNGEGVRVLNNGIGAAFLAQNTSTGIGFYINNGSTGIGLRINNDTSAIGDPFIYTLSGNLKAKIDYLGNITGNSFIKSGGLSSQFLKADGSVDSTAYQGAITLTTTGSSGASTLIGNTLNIPNYSPDLSGYVTLNTAQTITAAKTFTTSGGSNTLVINHSSGSGIALSITKGGNGEGIYVNKTSGSGNAVTIIGTLNATTLVKNGGTSSQFLKADGSVDSTAYGTGSVTSVSALTLGTSGTDLNSSVANGTTTPVITLNVPDASASNRGVITSCTCKLSSLI